MFNLLKFVFSPHQWVELFTFYGGGKDGGDAPDFTALAASADKAAVLGKELGDAQLAENKRQYDLNYSVQKPVTEMQLGLMGQTKEQGDDYFNYMKQYSRPAEISLFYEAMGFTPDEVQQIEDSRAAETTAFNASEQAKANAVTQKTIDVPVTTSEKKLPDGAVQGNALPAGAKIAGTASVPLDLYMMTNNMDSVKSALARNTLQYLNNPTADPNAYYVRNPDGTYRQVVATNQRVQGSKQVTVDVPSDYEASSVVKTPETDALTNKLAALASARMKAQSQAERDAIDAQSRVLEQRLGETNAQVYERYKNDIEAEADAAVADSRAGNTNALNVAARQGIRYGFSPAKLAAMASQQSLAQGAMQAAAANQTRKAATETMYGRGVAEASQGLTRVNANRSMKQQDDSLQFAKKLDLAGVYRGLPSASQGAYSASINAGNSAVGNQNATSAQYLQGMNAGTNTIMAGQQAKIGGLSNIAQMQTGMYNAQAGSGDAIWGALGQVGGAAASGWLAK